MICPRCQSENPEQARYCMNCGLALWLRCENCQGVLPPGTRFCLYCGQPVGLQGWSEETLHSRREEASVDRAAEGERIGERRYATVLLLDMVWSGQNSDQSGEDALSVKTRNLFERITAVIARFEGWIAHQSEDGLVAYFGLPLAHEEDPQRAVLAALEIVRLVGLHNQGEGGATGFKVAVRACLTYGLIQTASSAEAAREEGGLGGKAVVLASRMKSVVQPMSVWIGEDVYRFVAPFFECREGEPLHIEGRSAPLRMFQVVSSSPEPGRLRGLIGLESPLVGRNRELEMLMHLLEAVQAGLGRVVLVLGEPGVGKTRLIREWQAATRQRIGGGNVRWAEGRSHAYAQGMAYHFLAHLIRSLVGASRAVRGGEAGKALYTTIQELFGDPMITPGLEVYAPLAHLLDIEVSGAAKEEMRLVDVNALPSRYQASLRKLLEALAARQPLVLVLEDLHWIDPSSAEILARLLPLAHTTRLLFCLLTRPDHDTPGWRLVSAAREILGGSLAEVHLEALSERETRQLITNLLSMEVFSEKQCGLILKKSEGNPLFVEEIIRMLIEREAIIRKGDHWAPGGLLEEVVIPDHLQGLLMARIDRLPEDGRGLLRIASVIGRQFPIRVLHHVLRGRGQTNSDDIGNLISRLNTLENAGLVYVARVEPELEYTFQHTLMQEAAYASLIAEDRRKLHRAVGEAIEVLYPDPLDEYAAMLAYHFDQAGLTGRALTYFLMAGRVALASFANQEAEDHFRRALRLSSGIAQRAELLSGLGEAIYRQGRIQEGIQVWLEGVRLHQAEQDFRGVARLYARAARAAWHGGDTPGCLHLCQEGMVAVEGAEESPELALLLHETARAYYFNGMSAQASPLCRQALEIATRWQAIDVQADALVTLGILSDQPMEEAVRCLEKAVELSEAGQITRVALRAHNNLAILSRSVWGDNHTALQHYRRAAEIARRRSVPQEILLSMVGMFSVSLALGEFDAVEESLPEAENLARDLPDPGPAECDLRLIKANLWGMRGDWTTAIEMTRQVRDEARRRGDLQLLFNSLSALLNATLELDCLEGRRDWAEAEAAAMEAMQISQRGLGDPIGIRCRLSIVCSRRRDLEAAHQWLAGARQDSGKHVSIWDEISVLIAEAELALAEARWDEAQSAYESLVEIYSRGGERWNWANALQHLAELYVMRKAVEDWMRAQGMYNLALDLYRQMGAQGYAQIVEERLLALQAQAEMQVLAAQKMTREMAQAGKVQSSFLPAEIPRISGWSFAAVLEPAHETSGDYYDFIPLPGGLLGIVIADVTDKGAGAALFMASSRTLIRTYADTYPAQPDTVLTAVNRRLMRDTHGGLYVTAFYAVLHPRSGQLVYCNAGHNPPYLFKAGARWEAIALPATGMALGILAEAQWSQSSVKIDVGDVLLLYTDGATEAQNERQELFGEQRLLASARAHLNERSRRPIEAQEVQQAILEDIHAFVAGAVRVDDLTLTTFSRRR